MPDTTRMTARELDRLRRAGGCLPGCALRATAARTWADGASYAVVTGTHNDHPFAIEGGPPALKAAVAAAFAHEQGEEAPDGE